MLGHCHDLGLPAMLCEYCVRLVQIIAPVYDMCTAIPP